MMRKLFSLTAAGAMAVASMTAVAAPAAAQDYYGGGYGYQGGYAPVRDDRGYRGGGYGGGYRGDGYRGDRGYRGGRGYGGGSGYRGDAYYGRGYSYRGGRGYGRCRDSGTGGTILGAIAGGLLGNGVAGYGDRTTGTVLGAGVGALAGRAIDRNC